MSVPRFGRSAALPPDPISSPPFHAAQALRPQSEQEALLWTAETLARVLSRSLSTIWRLKSAGKLPKALRIGGGVLWRADEIRRWVDAGCPDRKAWEAIEATRNGRR